MMIEPHLAILPLTESPMLVIFTSFGQFSGEACAATTYFQTIEELLKHEDLLVVVQGHVEELVNAQDRETGRMWVSTA